MKSKILGLLAVGLLAGPIAANAALIRVDIVVTGTWTDLYGFPFGMPHSPTLSGTMIVDNSLTDASALKDFSLTTGTKTWTESLFVPQNNLPVFVFDGNGDLLRFDLFDFTDATGAMIISSANTFRVEEVTTIPRNNCNQCVSFTQRRVPVPEPGTLALVGLGLAGLGLSRRRKAA